MTTPRPTSRAEQRRRTEARILDAATRVFFSAGYDRATIRAVASAAGVDAGLVMHYFGSKQELFRRVIDAVPVSEVSAAPGQAAEQILSGLAERLESEPVASLTLLRSMLTTFINALMSAEADAVCGAPFGLPGADRSTSATGTGTATSTPGPARWMWRYRSCGRAATSRTGCWSAAAARRRPW